jgi:alanyl-tRNA synthetase
MGDQGPCGPCSEIHVDLRSDAEKSEVDGASLVNDHPPSGRNISGIRVIQPKADGSLKHFLHNTWIQVWDLSAQLHYKEKSNYDIPCSSFPTPNY